MGVSEHGRPFSIVVHGFLSLMQFRNMTELEEKQEQPSQQDLDS